MTRKLQFFSLLGCLSLLGIAPEQAAAAEPPAAADKLIVATPFDQDQPKTRKKPLLGWSAAIGEWWVADAALHGDEVAEDNHASSCTYAVDATHLVITAQFRLGTAQQIAFGCRDQIKPHHHLARAFISRDAIWITHMSGIAKTTRSQKIAELKTPLDPEKWHDLTIEIIGDHYRARIGDHVLEATHARFADPKGLVALITKGQGAQFKNVSLWHGKPGN